MLAEAIQRAASLKTYVKWPNDLLAGDPARKVGGVLLEHTHGWLLVGVGINVNSTPEDFPSDIAPTLTTISAEKRKPVDVGMLQIAVIRALRQLPDCDLTVWLARFRELDRTAGTRYTLSVQGKQVPVTAVGVVDSGELLLHDARGGEHRISAFTELERL
jgi:BirA family biotin operon repressor/biotin-[acetyl-CoA-carboxylase] ligase